ncbi:MAG: ferrous iron transporter B [Candidatus Obscuribacterales bacterium]
MSISSKEVTQGQGRYSFPPASTRKIALAGNPNVGKSVIFNALTGMSADVSNYPGTTIDVSRGKLGEYDIADTPGVYGVSSFNDEERAARLMILEADTIVNVASALSLDRDLFLSIQLIEMGKPLLLVINQWDEAQRRGMEIDTSLLSKLLGVPVLKCVAVRKEGIDEIRQNIDHATVGNVSEEVLHCIQPLLDKGIDQAHALLIAEGDELSATACGVQPLPDRAAIYGTRRLLANEYVQQCVTQEAKTVNFSIKLGRFLLHPVWGSLISFAVCYLIFYQLLGVLIAGTLVDITEKRIMKVYYEPKVRRLAANIFPSTITANDKTFDFPNGTLANPNEAAQLDSTISNTSGEDLKFNFWPNKSFMSVIGNILVGEYGLVTLTVTYLIGLLFPLVLGFYLGLSILEDSGYLPRLAVLVDRMMNKIGLNGRAIIPLILGLGCVTMATITTRLLSTKREKMIATALLGIAIPCSAQLGVVSGTLARVGGGYAWAVYLVVVTTILAVTGLLLNMIMPGKSGGLIMDLPPMRMPRADNVLKKTWSKSWNFLQDATPAFFIAGFAVTIAQMTGLLEAFIKLLQPVTVTLLNLPNDPRIATTFILGIVRRDFASFGLTEVPLTAVQAVTAMIVITLFVPCIATVGVMCKERGPKVAFTIWFGSWACAFVIGGAIARLLPPVFKLVGL